jgi:hypothetical protein
MTKRTRHSSWNLSLVEEEGMKKSQSWIIKVISLHFLRDGEKVFWVNNDEFVKRTKENHFSWSYRYYVQ